MRKGGEHTPGLEEPALACRGPPAQGKGAASDRVGWLEARGRGTPEVHPGETGEGGGLAPGHAAGAVGDARADRSEEAAAWRTAAKPEVFGKARVAGLEGAWTQAQPPRQWMKDWKQSARGSCDELYRPPCDQPQGETGLQTRRAPRASGARCPRACSVQEVKGPRLQPRGAVTKLWSEAVMTERALGHSRHEPQWPTGGDCTCRESRKGRG